MLQHFDTVELPEMPWKNGGGSTREIVCHPEGTGMDGFDWRVSIATIAQSGPFSRFDGVDRTIMLLAGDGVALTSAQGLDHRLDQLHTPFAFPGDVAVEGTLLGGASTDLNLMTRRGAGRAELVILRATTPLPVTERGLLLVLSGAWELPKAPRCGAGQGLWWEGRPYGGPAQTVGSGAALAWVRWAAPA